MMCRGLLCLLLLLPLVAHATPYYVDGTAGSDTNTGLSRTPGAGGPWRSWRKALNAWKDGIAAAGDTIYVRPGRYVANDGGRPFMTQGGGTAGNPLTLSVDTFYPGEAVEVLGAITGANWRPAKICFGGTSPGAPCDDADGTTNGARCDGGICSVLSNPTRVYWSADAAISGPAMSGMAFRPTITPGGAVCTSNADCVADGGSFCDLGNLTTNGEPIRPPLVPVHHCAPKFPEILYSPESTPIAVPTFTAGRFQTWVYAEVATAYNGAAICTASKVPWQCCTGVGTGPTCLGQHRVYVQMADGTSPTSPTNANPPVLLMSEQAIFACAGANSPCLGAGIHDTTLTNNNNGRTFVFTGAINSNLFFNSSTRITVEDFRLGYNSKSRILLPSGNPAGDSASGFPRNGAGDLYPIGATGFSALTFRRGIVHHSAGDEAFHAFVLNDTLPGMLGEDLEIYEQPWMVANGASNAASLGALVNSVDVYGYKVSWPPLGYAGAGTGGDPCTNTSVGWCRYYTLFMSPLGGGGQTPGVIIGSNNTLRRITYHHGASFQFEGHSVGNTFEDSTLDFTYIKYGDGATRPATPVGVFGFSGTRALSLAWSAFSANRPGNRLYNLLVSNCYGECLNPVGDQGGGDAPFSTLSPQIINCSFDIKANAVYASGPPSGNQLHIRAGFGTAGAKGLFFNNIVNRDAASGAFIKIAGANIGNMDMDYNLWGPNMRWDLAGFVTTSFPAWQTAWGGVNEQNSDQVGNVHFLSDTDLRLRSDSAAIDNGDPDFEISRPSQPCLTLTDVDGVVRYLGAGCDIGGAEFDPGAPPPTTSTSIPTTSSTTSTSTSTSTVTTVLGNTTSTSTTTSITSTSSTVSSTVTTLPGTHIRGITLFGIKLR